MRPHLIAALGGALAGALAGLLTLSGPALAAGEAAKTAPRPVVSEIVSADPTRQRAFPGQVEAAHETDLAFQTAGRVATLDVQAGDQVKKGQVLATLDRVSLQEDVDAAQAALASARAQADYAKQSYDRVTSLKSRNIATEADAESAKASLDSAQANEKAAEAKLDTAKDALDYATLTAPNAGVVLEKDVQAGTVVSSGTTVLKLADLTGREAVIDVPAEFMAVLPNDARFTLRRQEGDEESASARLRLIEPVADDTLRGRRLRLTILDQGKGPTFRIGSLVRATYEADREPVITLPESAIAGSKDKPIVWRVAGDSRVVHPVPVTLGVALSGNSGPRVEITSGIAVGDEIITRGAHSLKDGETVGDRVE